MNNINIYKPQLSDLPRLISLWQSQYEYHHNLDPDYYVPNSKKLDSQFEEYLVKAINEDDPHILIAEDNNNLVGFITYETAEADYFDTNFTKHGDVLELFVKGEYRKKGVGKQLMATVEKFFKEQDIKTMNLQSSTFNINAVSFYERLGFVNRQTLLYKEIKKA